MTTPCDCYDMGKMANALLTNSARLGELLDARNELADGWAEDALKAFYAALDVVYTRVAEMQGKALAVSHLCLQTRQAFAALRAEHDGARREALRRMLDDQAEEITANGMAIATELLRTCCGR